MSLRDFLRGACLTRRSYGNAAAMASALALDLERVAGEANIDASEHRLREFFEAATHFSSAEDWAVYALTLAAFAEHRFPLARQISERRARRMGVAAQAPSAQTVDFLALILGLLRSGQSRALVHTAERVLFRRRLSDNSVIRARHARHEQRTGSLRAILLHVIGHDGDPAINSELPFLRCFAAVEALSISSEQMQLMGGTGYMRESKMPEVRDAIIALVETQRPERLLSDADLFAWYGGPLPAWLADPDAYDDAPAAASQRELLHAIQRFAAGCAIAYQEQEK
jgi:hypothetical protein